MIKVIYEIIKITLKFDLQIDLFFLIAKRGKYI